VAADLGGLSATPLCRHYAPWVKVRELIRLIEADGWELVRTRGSHRQFRHDTKPGLVTIAGKPSADVPPGTLESVLKQAGLK
jgi:predicted RNA binding protein YcfA (HicA-like mRNA interferase family)